MTTKRYTADEIVKHAKWISQYADYLGFRAMFGDIAAMLRQAAEDCDDAERYRWLRDSSADNIQNGGTHLEVFADNGYEGKWVGSDLDDVVDNARTQEKVNG